MHACRTAAINRTFTHCFSRLDSKTHFTIYATWLNMPFVTPLLRKVE